MAYVKNHNGSPTIFIDDKPFFGAMVKTDKIMKGWKGEPNPPINSIQNLAFIICISVFFLRFSYEYFNHLKLP